MRFSISASSCSSWRRRSSCARCFGLPCVALRVGRRQHRQLAPDLRQQLLLLLLQLLDLRAARPRSRRRASIVRRRRQRRRGAALVGLAAAGQVGLRDGLRLGRRLVGARVDQDHLQRRVLEHAVEALGVDEAHRQQHGVHAPATPAAPAAGCVRPRKPIAVPDSALRPPAAASSRRPSAGSSQVDGQAQRAGVGGFRPRPRARPARARRRAAGARRGAPARWRARRASAGRCRSMRTRTRAPRGRLSAPSARNTSGSVSARTRPSFITRGVEFAARRSAPATAASSSVRCRAGSRCRRA